MRCWGTLCLFGFSGVTEGVHKAYTTYTSVSSRGDATEGSVELLRHYFRHGGLGTFKVDLPMYMGHEPVAWRKQGLGSKKPAK